METFAKKSFSQPTRPAQERGHVGSNRRVTEERLSRSFGCYIMMPHDRDTRHEATECNVHPTGFSVLLWSLLSLSSFLPCGTRMFILYYYCFGIL